MRPPKPTRAELQLKQENDGLKTTIIGLRHELTNKQGHIERLKYLLCARLARIDQLNAKLDQARTANHRLEEECEHLAALIANSATPPLNNNTASA